MENYEPIKGIHMFGEFIPWVPEYVPMNICPITGDAYRELMMEEDTDTSNAITFLVVDTFMERSRHDGS